MSIYCDNYFITLELIHLCISYIVAMYAFPVKQIFKFQIVFRIVKYSFDP